MTIDEKGKPKQADSKTSAPASGGDQPQWARGLRRLYDSVVDEPLPDQMKDLLSKLDDGADGSKDG